MAYTVPTDAYRAGLPEKFVILAAPRTGSNMLCTLLDSHPDILCHHEVFNPAGIFYALPYRGAGQNPEDLHERDRRPLQFLEQMWAAIPGFRKVGFKMTRGQDRKVLDYVLADIRIAKIILRRRNRIRTYVSEQIARTLDSWEIYARKDLPRKKPAIRIEKPALMAHIAENENYYAYIEHTLAAHGRPAIHTFYEDLFFESERRRILDFLGVEAHLDKLRIRSLRQNAESLQVLIANYAELSDTLAGSDLYADLQEEGCNAPGGDKTSVC